MPCSRTQHGDASGVRTQDLSIRLFYILSQTYNATRLRHLFLRFTAMQDGLPDICWSAIASEELSTKSLVFRAWSLGGMRLL